MRVVSITTAQHEPRSTRSARAEMRINVALIALLIASAIYAPLAAYPELVWMACSCCAGLLTSRGVNWKQAWERASFSMMGK